MVRIFKSKKALITGVSATSVVAAGAIAIPTGIIYGSKNSKDYTEEVESINVYYGTELSIPSRAGYKTAVLDTTNYTKTSTVGQTGVYASYFLDLDGSNSELKPIHLTRNITIKDINYDERNEMVELAYGSDMPEAELISDYKAPFLDKTVTNYTKDTPIGTANVKVAYCYEPDSLSKVTTWIHLVKNINVTHGPNVLESVTLSIKYGSQLVKPANRQGFKAPTLDKTNYSPTGPIWQKNMYASYLFLPETSNIEAKPIYLTQKFTFEITEESKVIDLLFSSQLPKIEKRANYKEALLEITNYTPTTEAGQEVATASYYFIPENSTNSNPIHLFVKINVLKQNSQEPNVATLVGNHQAPFDLDPEFDLSKPNKVNNYLDWTIFSYSTIDGENLNLSDVKKIPVTGKYIVKYRAIADSNHVGNDIFFIDTITVTNAKAAILENSVLNKEFLYGLSVVPLSEIPQTIKGYSIWSAPSLTLNDINNTKISSLFNLKIGDTFSANYKATLLPNYEGKNEITLRVIYAIKEKIAIPSQSGTIEADYFYGSKSLPTNNEKIGTVTGYLPWETPVYKTLDNKYLRNANDINLLEINSKFTATYIARKDVNYGTKEDAIYVVNYTIRKGITTEYPNGYLEKVFLNNATSLPYDKSTLVAGYLDWVIRYTSEDKTKTYTSLDEIKNLQPGSSFYAIYRANPDPKYNTTKYAEYVVKYKVKFPGSNFSNKVELTQNYVYGTSEYPTSNKPSVLVGYNDWQTPIYSSKDGKIVYASASELAELNVGSEFIATYNASPDERYDVFENAKAIITFSVIKAPETTPQIINREATFIYGSTTFPNDHAPTNKEIGYLSWEPAIYSSRDGIIRYNTGLELSVIRVDSKFIATYTAQPDSNYNNNKSIKMVVTYTVKAPTEIIESYENKEFNSTITYGSNILPINFAPNGIIIGYKKWSTAKYSSVDTKIIYSSKEDIAKINAGEKFIATYEAEPDSNYLGTRQKAVIKVVYTVTKAPKVDPPQILESTKEFVYGSTTFAVDNGPKVRAQGYKEWELPTYFSENQQTSYNLNDLAELPINSKFVALYKAYADSNYENVGSITYKITYTVGKIKKPSLILPVETKYTANFVYGTRVGPRNYEPTTTAEGYQAWSSVTYSSIDKSKTYSEFELSTLPANSQFLATYVANPSAIYDILSNAKIIVSYKIIQANVPKVLPALNETLIAEFDRNTTTLPKYFAPKDSVEGYLSWELISFTSADGLSTFDNLSQLQNLSKDSKFIATYIAKKDSNYNTPNDAIAKILYTVFETNAISIKNYEADFFYGSNFLPSDYAPTVETLNFSPWSVPTYTSLDETTEYRTFEELKNLTPGNKFKATYFSSSKIDARKNKVIVTYNVLKGFASPINDSYQENIFLAIGKPDYFKNSILGNFDGYLAPAIHFTDKRDDGNTFDLITYTEQEVLRMPVNSKVYMTAVYQPNPNYNITKPFKKEVQFVLKYYAPDPSISGTGVFLKDLLPVENNFFAASKPTIGYKMWGNRTFLSFDGTLEYTLEQVKNLSVGSQFYLEYTAQPETDYLAMLPARIIILYTVKNQAPSIARDLTFKANFIYNTKQFPNEQAPTTKKVGYNDWTTARYYSLDNLIEYKTVEELAALNAGTKFNAIYSATPDKDYDVTKTIKVIVTYSVVPADATFDPSQTFEESFLYGTNELPIKHAPTQTYLGYKSWSSPIYSSKNGTRYTTGAELSKLNAGTEFFATYTAPFDLNYNNYYPANIVVKYKVAKLPKTTNHSNITLKDNFIILVATTMPNSYAPTTKNDGYLGWQSVIYSSEDGKNIYRTFDDLKALRGGSKFIATYVSPVDPNYDNDEPEIIRVTYTVVKLPKTNDPSIDTLTSEFNIKSKEMPNDHRPTSKSAGYKIWSDAEYSSPDGTIKYWTLEHLKALAVGEKFIATYYAQPDLSYDINTPAKVVVTYTCVVVRLPATNDPSILNLTSDFNIYADETIMPSNFAPTTEYPGYLKWSAPVYSSLNGGTIYTDISQLTNLRVDSQFKATYTAQPDPDYAIDKPAQIVVTYTCIAQKLGKTEDPSKTVRTFIAQDATTIAESDIFHMQHAKGYKTWYAITDVVDFEYYEIGSTFTMKWKADPDPRYSNEQPAIITYIYTVKKPENPRDVPIYKAYFDYGTKKMPDKFMDYYDGFSDYSGYFTTYDERKELSTYDELDKNVPYNTKFKGIFSSTTNLKASKFTIIYTRKLPELLDPDHTATVTYDYSINTIVSDDNDQELRSKIYTKNAFKDNGFYLDDLVTKFEFNQENITDLISKKGEQAKVYHIYSSRSEPDFDPLLRLHYYVTYNFTNKTEKSNSWMFYFKNAKTLPALKTGELNSNYQGWTYTFSSMDGKKVYKTVDELNALPAETLFRAIYIAKPKSDVKNVAFISIIVNYKVILPYEEDPNWTIKLNWNHGDDSAPTSGVQPSDWKFTTLRNLFFYKPMYARVTKPGQSSFRDLQILYDSKDNIIRATDENDKDGIAIRMGSLEVGTIVEIKISFKPDAVYDAYGDWRIARIIYTVV